ncbi:MAG: hypothetical protein UT82_C0037G0007 [Parcubacteria group bacterium GW2011_GWB1_40_14]|nr:MAG: hypothetical protein UT82_C0037G0007 [Parcubacteria group bacterium GW2011_GWB1_40_14]
MHRVGRAWLRLTQAFETGRLKSRVHACKSWRNERKLRDQLYDRLMHVVTDLGIKVHTQQEFEPVKDFYGQVWTPAGQWTGLRQGIRIRGEGDFALLAHEFAHGIDEMLINVKHGAHAELVASCASYLFCIEYFGRGNLAHALHYPTQSWGATVEDFRKLEDYIIDVYRQMTILFAMDSKN